MGKSDLLFSSIVAKWQEGRKQIEEFITTINKKGRGFKFDNDFIMRCCLVLTDSPVLFKVSNFTGSIDKIISKWEKIKESITQTVDLLETFGFSGEKLTSQNAIIPIAYHFIIGGNRNKKSCEAIHKYLIHALLKTIFSSKTDEVLKKLRESLCASPGSVDTPKS